MATLIFSAIGTMLGGPLGGAIGALAGRQVDAAIIGGGNREGPRLKDLAISTSSYGTPIPLQFGRMRVAGSIIWATDLVEHSERSGGGKGRPSVTTYSYSASFAVALSSRPIRRLGRIWADGNLLRGAGGDLKTGGALRIYTGEHDQPADPLIAAAEGANMCPAFRGLAYAVFEDLDLSDFFNRIPTLTFEVIADDGEVLLQTLLESALDEVDALAALAGVSGLSLESPVAETLAVLDSIYAFDCHANASALSLRPALQGGAAAVLGEAIVTSAQDGFGKQTGIQRRRSARAESPPQILRYYDVDRDYQPGLQRTPGRPSAGQPRTIEMPVATSAAEARGLADRMARQQVWRSETLAWRNAEIDAAVVPGSLASVPGADGLWRVAEWEWNDTGVELLLERIPGGNAASGSAATDPGRINPPQDLAAAPTLLAAVELPWDGVGSGQEPMLIAAASSTGAGWTGAALYADTGNGQLQPIGSSRRQRSIIGTAETALPFASPHVFDRASLLDVRLAATDLTLAPASPEQLAQGGNRALIGTEIIQFCNAELVEPGLWRLSGLLRGRGGTEQAIASHVSGDQFVLLNETPVALIAPAGGVPLASVAAIGRADPEPVISTIALRGITQRPLPPVHPHLRLMPGGELTLSWTRRARGGWQWLDGVDTPLNEQTESYQVSYGPASAPLAAWDVSEPSLTLPGSTVAQLAALSPGLPFHVRQRGSYALSDPAFLATLPPA